MFKKTLVIVFLLSLFVAGLPLVFLREVCSVSGLPYWRWRSLKDRFDISIPRTVSERFGVGEASAEQT